MLIPRSLVFSSLKSQATKNAFILSKLFDCNPSLQTKLNETSESCKSTMKEKTRSWSTTSKLTRKTNSGSLPPDHQTLEIHWTPRLKLTTGSMRTDSGMRRTRTTTWRELRSTCFRDSCSAAISLELRLLSPAYTSRWSPGQDTSETLTKSSISLSSHPEKFSRHPGMESLSSLEDWLFLKSERRGPSQTQLLLIRPQSLLYQTQETQKCLCVQLFALT